VRQLAALLAACALAGCATPLPQAGGGWTSGRLNLRVDATPERIAQTVTAAFELQGNSERGELRLLSPLGTQVAAARWAPGEAVLNTAGGAQRFQSLPELSRQALGEDLPLAALPDWLAGRPWPAAPHTLQAAGFEQLGWQVGLARRAEGWIDARRESPPVVTLRVRLDSPAP
jgi:outer membrane lipoprotein LolB